MIEIIGFAVFAVAAGVSWYLHRRGGKKAEMAADLLDIGRFAAEALAEGILKAGKDKAVDYAVAKLGYSGMTYLAHYLHTDQRGARKWLADRLALLLRYSKAGI